MIKKLLPALVVLLAFLTGQQLKAQTSLQLDYATMEYQDGQVFGDSTRLYLWDMNKNLPSDSTFSMRFAAVNYDSLWQWNFNTGSLTASLPRATSTVRLDSFQLIYKHIRTVTSTPD